jgi:hypothetical protein
VLLAPSVLAPNENNWLINPAHTDLQKDRRARSGAAQHDPRMHVYSSPAVVNGVVYVGSLDDKV